MSTRPVPTNLDSWPGVTDLLIEQKYLLHVLWSTDSKIVSVIGVGRPGVIERLGSASRLAEPVVIEALRELDRRALVVLDEASREVAVRRWVRFHKFSGKWAAVAEAAYSEIQSARIKSVLVQQEGLKSIFPVKSDISPATATATATATISACTPDACCVGEGRASPARANAGAKRKVIVDGVETWTQADREAVGKMIDEYGKEKVLFTSKKIAGQGCNPFPSAVLKELKGKMNYGTREKHSNTSVADAGRDLLAERAARSQQRRGSGESC